MLMLRLLLFRLLALGSLLLGFIGVVLPGLPTVPFILLAAFAAGKGWPQLEARLLAHTTYGPLIHNWRAFGVVPRSGKIAASLMMGISLLLCWVSSLMLTLKLVLTLLLTGVAFWLWQRPEQARQKHKKEKK